MLTICSCAATRTLEQIPIDKINAINLFTRSPYRLQSTLVRNENAEHFSTYAPPSITDGNCCKIAATFTPSDPSGNSRSQPPFPAERETEPRKLREENSPQHLRAPRLQSDGAKAQARKPDRSHQRRPSAEKPVSGIR